MESVADRLDRLASIESIRQLAARYALAVDARDLDALVELFPADVQVGRDRTGRPALRAWFDATLRNRFTRTTHFVGNHVIDLSGDADSPGVAGASAARREDPGGSVDTARGVVYCRAEHEMGDRFVVAQMQYWDQYERCEGRWYFRRRRPLFQYVVPDGDPPVGEQLVRWPDREPSEAPLPDAWPSWTEFWASGPDT